MGPVEAIVALSEDGSAVALRDHVVPGRVTVFDFHADWCAPCKDLDAHLMQVVARHDDVIVRKIDVVDWDSEAAKKHLVNVPNLPYVIVYGANGRVVARISGLRLDELDAAIERGRR